MSQITCCPNCSTSFRVTDAQLAAHQGKVRCGRCAFVFHAPDFIQALMAESPSALDLPSSAVTNPSNLVEPSAAIATPNTLTSTETATTETEGIATEANQTKAFDEIPRENQHTLAQLALEESELDAALAKDEAFFDEVDAATPTNTENLALEIDSDSEYQPILSDDDLFTPPTKTRSSWLWTVGSVLAALILVAQLGFVFRQTLSQEFPVLRPKYLALCAHLECSLPLPREAQLLRSEYSELTFIPNNPTLIQLNATLRNLAPFEQELPKLELTLTDENEKVIVRKIFTAQQYLVQNERVQNSIEANEEVRAFLQLDLGELHSTGYSLYWFY
ncbi:DUF3426 domain-containing protein [Deefgea rivuli]|uniref:DUF3426 domain-containing protein n=1 Tax=Deefgea rivuli TaxID=400948 RepID=UPI0004830B28|nr:DUF3426 domain-containing protein [Deefgea rivuli]